MKIKIYVEGGPKGRYKTEIRRGFTKFFEKAGLGKCLPSVISSQDRNKAYSRFKHDPHDGYYRLLLVDSESAVDVSYMGRPWDFLRHAYLNFDDHGEGKAAKTKNDDWTCPAGYNQEQAHLMVQCMENWFLADAEALKDFYGKGFEPNRLPKDSHIEHVAKKDAQDGLELASAKTRKEKYDKNHGFELIGLINPTKVAAASPWAARLLDFIKEKNGIKGNGSQG